MSPSKDHSQYIILGISLALFIWGTVHAVGAYRYDYDVRKPLIVYACIFFFLGFWWIMLAVRRRAERIKFEQLSESEENDRND